MKLSARNQLKGTISHVVEGAVNAIVTVDVDGVSVSSTISMNAVKELGLKAGKKAYAIVKATSVMIAKDKNCISARNQLKGKITNVVDGAVNAIVHVQLDGGQEMAATISMNAVKELGLNVDQEVYAVVKSTSVMIGVD